MKSIERNTGSLSPSIALSSPGNLLIVGARDQYWLDTSRDIEGEPDYLEHEGAQIGFFCPIRANRRARATAAGDSSHGYGQI